MHDVGTGNFVLKEEANRRLSTIITGGVPGGKVTT